MIPGYVITNYSKCFSSAICPTVPSLLTRVEGFYIYYADGRRVMRYFTPPGNLRQKTTYYTLPTIATSRKPDRTTQWKDRRRYTPQKTGSYTPWSDDTTTSCGSCVRGTNKLPKPQPHKNELDKLLYLLTKTTKEHTRKRTTKRTTKRITKHTTAKPTTQVTGKIIILFLIILLKSKSLILFKEST